jgi:hypothetical protein
MRRFAVNPNRYTNNSTCPDPACAGLCFVEHLVRHRAEYETIRATRREAGSTLEANLAPLDSYLRSGRKKPVGSPKQTKWAVDIKARLWPKITATLRWLSINDPGQLFCDTLNFLALAGYDEAVSPPLRSLYFIRLMDHLDQVDAKLLIDAEAYKPKTCRVAIPAVGVIIRPDFRNSMTVSQRVLYESLVEYRCALYSELWSGPTPDHWIAELRQRGLRADTVVTDADRLLFASRQRYHPWKPWQAGRTERLGS